MATLLDIKSIVYCALNVYSCISYSCISYTPIYILVCAHSSLYVWVNALQHSVSHCNTLQHTTAHCHTLPHTATHKTCSRPPRPQKAASEAGTSTCISPGTRQCSSADMCDAIHSYVWQDSFMCVQQRWYVSRHSFICVTQLIYMCDMTHSYVWQDSFICVPWLIDMCAFTNPHVTRALRFTRACTFQ